MPGMDDRQAGGRRPWFGGSLRRLGDSVLSLVETRLQILALEWAEERANLARVLVVVFLVVWCLHLAIILGLVGLLLAVGAEHRVLVLGLSALSLVVVAAGASYWLRTWLKGRRPMFATTLDELRKDRDWLRGQAE